MTPPDLFVLLTQAPTGAPVVVGAKIESVWDFVIKGGPTMIAIAACSLVALAIVAERSVVLRRRSVVPPAFLAGLKAVWHDRARAIDYCRANSSAIASLLLVVAKRRGRPRDEIAREVDEAGRREVSRLRQRLRVLGTLPQVSTMLGLLGTIFGMIKTFQAVAASGQSLGKTELLAKGIFEAWTCTAAGLLVAIPVLVMYQWLMGRAEAMTVELDRTVAEWLDDESDAAPAPAARAAEARRDPSPEPARGVIAATA